MLQYRTTPLPERWPGKLNGERGNSPFKSNWGDTMSLLERELRQLGASDVSLAIGVLASHIRNDGGVRADARIREPGVVLSFTAGKDRLTFPCDRYNYWQDNVRAIALALEALRKVDRYGVQSGRQYQGFKALSSGDTKLLVGSAHDAARVLSEATGNAYSEEEIVGDGDTARRAVRLARSRAHPDAGGSVDDLQKVQNAAARLNSHFGVQL